MTVEERADDAAVQHAVIRFVFRGRLPLSDDFVTVGEAADVQTFWVCRATAEAGEAWSEGFLNALHRNSLLLVSSQWSVVSGQLSVLTDH